MKIGARKSPLSRVQVEEVKQKINAHLHITWVETLGDKDKTTSLRTLDKTDFFTRELDELVLSGAIDAAIHSAKDLPDPLPPYLILAALTPGLDPRDSLVFKRPLPQNPLIATSSARREEAVRSLYPHARFLDLRGTIQERLAQLDNRIDAIVVAECALIRLQLTHLNRLFLPGPTTPHQGRLAIICHINNQAAFTLFSALHDPALSRP